MSRRYSRQDIVAKRRIRCAVKNLRHILTFHIVCKQPTSINKASGSRLGRTSGQRLLPLTPMERDFTGSIKQIATGTDAILAAAATGTISAERKEAAVPSGLASDDMCACNCRKTSFLP